MKTMLAKQRIWRMARDWTDARHWLRKEINRKYSGDNLSDLYYLSEQFFKSANGNGQTTYKMIEKAGSARNTDLDGIVQSFQMKHGYLSSLFRKEKGQSIADAFRLIPFVVGEVYKPNKPALLRNNNAIYFNTWIAPEITYDPKKPLYTDAKPFYEFLHRMFPDQEQGVFFLHWIAATVARPEWYMDLAPVLRSEQGIGKNLLWDRVIKPLAGTHNAPVCSLRQLTHEFSGGLFQSTAVMVDEVYADKKSSADRLKGLITGRSAIINKKKDQQYEDEVNFNMLITSNTDIPLYIEDGDRRYWVPDFIRHRDSLEETKEWISGTFVPWLTDESMPPNAALQAIRNALEDIANELTETMFDGAPNTKAKMAIISQDLKPTRKAHLQDFLDHRRNYRFDIPSLQRHEMFKYLAQGDIRAVMGTVEFAKWDDKKQMYVGKRRRDLDEGGPETFEHKSIKRTDHPPLWTIELERSGQVLLTTDDEIFDGSRPEEERQLLGRQKNKIENLTDNMLKQNEDWTDDEVKLRDLVLKGRTVVANKKRHQALISWADEFDLKVDIMREFKDGKRIDVWGNDDDRRPVSLEIRKNVCDSFEQQYKRSPMMQQQIGDLVGKVLVCVCAPMQCHGDYLAEKANKHGEEKLSA